MEESLDAQVVRDLKDAARRFATQVSAGLRNLPNGLTAAPYDPTPLIEAFPHLSLRDGYRLASYQFIAGGNGNGFVFVIPADRELPPPPAEGFRLQWGPYGWPTAQPGQPPLPEWVRSDIAAFLEGDGSPASYFETSLFVREARELGAMWHGVSWGTHSILTDGPGPDPYLSSGPGPGRQPEWTWSEPPPTDWRPLVSQNEEGKPTVLFYTQSSLWQRRIVRHLDTYEQEYLFRAETTDIALGGPGFVF